MFLHPISQQPMQPTELPPITAPSIVLLTEVFLDSGTDTLRINAELRRRGYLRPIVSALRVMLGFALWWNVFWWEPQRLGWPHVLCGYGLDLCLAAPIVFGFAIFSRSLPTLLAGVLLAAVGLAVVGAARWLSHRPRSKGQ